MTTVTPPFPVHAKFAAIQLPSVVLSWLWVILGPLLNAVSSPVVWPALATALESGFVPGQSIPQDVIAGLNSVAGSVATIFPGSTVEQVTVAAACQGAAALISHLYPATTA